MTQHSFTLRLSGPFSDAYADRLYGACDDGVLSVSNGVIGMSFVREAPSYEAALDAAQKDVRQAGVRVLGIDPYERLEMPAEVLALGDEDA